MRPRFTWRRTSSGSIDVGSSRAQRRRRRTSFFERGDVRQFRDKPISWISQYHFFRDPIRPTYSDLSYFFSPADGIILYQRKVRPDECIVEIKGRAYSLRDAMRDPDCETESLVIGIFMTFFDVHVNRVPYPGRLSYTEMAPIDTYNHP